jgi:small subunit ribosomal protein S7
MKDGKKTKSQCIMTKTLTRLSAETQMGSPSDHFTLLCEVKGSRVENHKIDSIRFLMKAIDNVKPVLEVTKMRLAGSTQFVPKIIPQNRQQSLAIRWLIDAAQKRKRRNRPSTHTIGHTQSDVAISVKSGVPDLSHFLVLELIDAFNQVGSVQQKRDELHQLAEANRGFSHYRWW